MMKSIVDENLVSFKVLEQKIFDYVCELGRLITQQVLENYDKELAQGRDKKLYRGKGKRKTKDQNGIWGSGIQSHCVPDKDRARRDGICLSAG